MALARAEEYGALVLVSLKRLGSDPRLQRGSDALLAAVLLIAALVEITGGVDDWSGPTALEVVLAFASTVPLIWRRSHPRVVVAVITAAALATAAAVAPLQGPFEPFVAFEIAVYSVGVHCTKRQGLFAVAGVVAAGAATWAVTTAFVDGANYGDWFPALAYAILAWLLGRVIRRRNERTRELERLTRELEEERDARAREAVTVERARIARELHDVIAHNVTVIGVQAAAAGRIMKGDEPDVRDALSVIETTSRQTVDEMRRMLGVLRKNEDEIGLAPQPSLRDLDSLVEQVRGAGLDVDVLIEGEPRPLPAGLDLSAYRIVQEALTNALKHAAPAHVDLAVRYLEDRIVLDVVDDGTRPVPGHGTGNGLVGMRERAALFGGDLSAGRRVEGGWELHVTLPVGAA